MKRHIAFVGNDEFRCVFIYGDLAHATGGDLHYHLTQHGVFTEDEVCPVGCGVCVISGHKTVASFF